MVDVFLEKVFTDWISTLHETSEIIDDSISSSGIEEFAEKILVKHCYRRPFSLKHNGKLMNNLSFSTYL